MTGLMFAGLALVVLLATMLPFALRRDTRPVDADVLQRGGSPLLGLWVRAWMVWLLAPLERSLAGIPGAPTMLNVAGLVFSAGAGLALAARAPAAAAWLIALGGIADILDGRIARSTGTVSRVGSFLDSTLDRFGEAMLFMGAAWYLSEHRFGSIVASGALAGSLLVSYTRARGEALGVVARGGLVQRAERIVLLAFATFADPLCRLLFGWPAGVVLFGALVVLFVSSWATAVHRAVIIVRALSAAGVSGDRA